VTKHAGVDRATVRLEEDEGHLVIRVIDEGAGFDVDEVIARASHDGGFGFFSVRERLDLVGGRLEVDSAPDKGTTVAIHAPVQPTRPN
jgi:signal transduction histidine kinase